MRIGLIGPAAKADEEALREAAEFLLLDAHADPVIYLGDDDAAERLCLDWELELRAELPDGDFLTGALALALEGAPPEIERLLERDRQRERLSRLRTLPPPPARAVEMVGDRIVLVVYDKKVLDEDDIANASIIVYGRSEEELLKRFGPRAFFTPGPLSRGVVGVLEVEDDGRVALATFSTEGEPRGREVLHGGASKLTVSR
ncbi:MAG: hypothetical protein AAGH15_19305 [Myxococcota bacterium]